VSSIAASPDGQVLLASTANGRTGSVLRSEDGGSSWQVVQDDVLQAERLPAVFAFHPTRDGYTYAATAFGTVLASQDSGATWTVIRKA
ncbi:MAG TPA: hypothetical protein VFH47_00475, partial [Candidatus Thermoplasmatota archaeon]|nr:hypothetical protein [Candidatus Thermoplasmatota archaeon]